MYILMKYNIRYFVCILLFILIIIASIFLIGNTFTVKQDSYVFDTNNSGLRHSLLEPKAPSLTLFSSSNKESMYYGPDIPSMPAPAPAPAPVIYITGSTPTGNTPGSVNVQNYTPTSNNNNNNVRNYDYGNLNVEYHDTIQDMTDQMAFDPSDNLINVLDASGNLVEIPLSSTMNKTTYYDDRGLVYNPSNYVSTYEDTIYFSKLTGLGYQSPIYGTNAQFGGFCTNNKDFPDKIEGKCQSLDADTCASTACCVLLGGTKCVAGNKQGPRMLSHYNDPTVSNSKKYFYRGHCYGNCIDDQSNFYNYNNEILTKDDANIHMLNLKTSPYDPNNYYNNYNENISWQAGQTTGPQVTPVGPEAAQSVGSACKLDKMGILRDNNNKAIADHIFLDAKQNFVDSNGKFISCVTSPSNGSPSTT